MIEEFKGFRASDGKLFTQEQEAEAIEYEARTLLQKCIGEPCTVEIMNKQLAVFEALAPLVSYLKATAERAGAERPPNIFADDPRCDGGLAGGA
jgi:hypothetical protein